MTQSAVLPATARLPLQLEDGATTFDVVRAWPRSLDHLLLELRPRDEQQHALPPVAAQWFADPLALAAAAEAAPAPARRFGPVLLQPAGVDPRMPALAEILTEPGAQLIAHRPGRRGVVRVNGPAGHVFVKVVRRARRAADVLRRGTLVRELVGTEVIVPEVVGSDVERGVVRWGDVGGRTLYELGASWSPAEAYAAWEQAGRAVAVLHGADPARVADQHDDDAELAGADRWLGPAIAHGRLDPHPVSRARERVRAALAALPEPAALGVLHRDLHDKQLLLRRDGQIAMIDVDTLAVGERAVDLANVLVHLELRQAQGLITGEAAGAAWQGLRAGLVTAAAERGQQGLVERAWQRVPAYALACRLRMAGIYAFRPEWRLLAQQMLAELAEDR